MALQKTVTTIHGFEAEQAYHRVEGVMLSAKDQIEFQLRSYKNNEPNSFAFADQHFSCVYDLNTSNPIKQAYEYLKTRSEFSDATDV